jgi:hypothetical protein
LGVDLDLHTAFLRHWRQGFRTGREEKQQNRGGDRVPAPHLSGNRCAASPSSARPNGAV